VDILWTASFGNGLDGANPEGEVVFDTAGNLYGTTYDGGKYGQSYGGVGTFYELSPSVGGGWPESKLYSFGGTNNDAGYPQAGLIINSRGILYGTSTAVEKSAMAPSSKSNLINLVRGRN